MIKSMCRMTSVFLTVTSSLVGAASLSEVVEQNRPSVIFIKVQKVNPTNGAITEEEGTGFIVNKEGYVITSGHLIASGAGIQLDVRGSPASRESTLEGMEVLFENSNFDVAVLRFKNTAIKRIPVKLGDPWTISDAGTVYSMGFPDKEEWFHTEGKLSGKNGPKGSWNTTLVLNPGMSGGPVFDTEGRVIAVVWGGVPTAGIVGINRILPINVLPQSFIGSSTSASSLPSIQTSKLDRGIEVPYKIEAVLEPTRDIKGDQKNFNETFKARPGYKIVDWTLLTKSSSKADIGNIVVAPDKKSLSISYALKSGPIFDQWRGWLDAEILTRQEKE